MDGIGQATEPTAQSAALVKTNRFLFRCFTRSDGCTPFRGLQRFFGKQNILNFMPINPPNRNGVTNRRMASPKRNNSITSSEYPIVTKTVYDGLIRNQGGEANIATKRLVAGRNQMARLMMTIEAAMRDHNPQLNAQPSATYNRLRQLRIVLDREFLKYPLTIA